MRKIVVFAVVLFAALSPRVFAAQELEQVLSDKINSEGVFHDGRGVIFAGEVTFENKSLLIVSARGSSVTYDIYGDADGIQLTDSISFDMSEYTSAKTGIKTGEKTYIVLSSIKNGKSVNELYEMRGDTLLRSPAYDAAGTDYITGCENGKIISYKESVSAYDFLNRLKEKTIAGYSLTNRINSLPENELAQIRKTITACADIMKFDIKDYDYDFLFKYILYTHDNFRILTDIPALFSKSDTQGVGSVCLVSSDYIDYIMTKIFRIAPEKPPVNNLTSRGFCYNDGYYLYTGGFDVYFATEISDIVGVYDIGAGTCYVVFSDVYSEGGSRISEYSFAILQKTEETYSVLRLGMGEGLPSEEEVRRYSPYSMYAIDQNGEASGKSRAESFLLPMLLLVFSVGSVGLVCSVIVLVRSKK